MLCPTLATGCRQILVFALRQLITGHSSSVIGILKQKEVDMFDKLFPSLERVSISAVFVLKISFHDFQLELNRRRIRPDGFFSPLPKSNDKYVDPLNWSVLCGIYILIIYLLCCFSIRNIYQKINTTVFPQIKQQVE